jgi:hypothetical protein
VSVRLVRGPSLRYLVPQQARGHVLYRCSRSPRPRSQRSLEREKVGRPIVSGEPTCCEGGTWAPEGVDWGAQLGRRARSQEVRRRA